MSAAHLRSSSICSCSLSLMYAMSALDVCTFPPVSPCPARC